MCIRDSWMCIQNEQQREGNRPGWIWLSARLHCWITSKILCLGPGGQQEVDEFQFGQTGMTWLEEEGKIGSHSVTLLLFPCTEGHKGRAWRVRYLTKVFKVEVELSLNPAVSSEGNWEVSWNDLSTRDACFHKCSPIWSHVAPKISRTCPWKYLKHLHCVTLSVCGQKCKKKNWFWDLDELLAGGSGVHHKGWKMNSK